MQVVVMKDAGMNGYCWSGETQKGWSVISAYAREMNENEKVGLLELLNMRLNVQVDRYWSVFRDIIVAVNYDPFLIYNRIVFINIITALSYLSRHEMTHKV